MSKGSPLPTGANQKGMESREATGLDAIIVLIQNTFHQHVPLSPLVASPHRSASRKACSASCTLPRRATQRCSLLPQEGGYPLLWEKKMARGIMQQVLSWTGPFYTFF